MENVAKDFMRGPPDRVRTDIVAFVIAARRERIEPHADMREAFDLPGSPGVGHYAAELRAGGKNCLAVDDDGPRDVRVDRLFDTARVGADACIEHDRQACPSGKSDFTCGRRRDSRGGGVCSHSG